MLAAGLATAGWLAVGITGASAQAVIVDPYVDAYVDPYPVIAPRPVIVVPRPVVRQRTVVITRPANAAVPPVALRVPGYAYPADVAYGVGGW
jgi:hypothetical protein